VAPLDARVTHNDALTITAAGLDVPLRWLPDWMAALVDDDSAASRAASQETTLGYEDVIVGAQRLFKSEGWRITDQSARMTAFVGKPRIPFYRRGLLKHRGFSTVVVSATAVRGGTRVVVEYPAAAEDLARRFVESLPPKESVRVEAAFDFAQAREASTSI
jgi:hypothetical protein